MIPMLAVLTGLACCERKPEIDFDAVVRAVFTSAVGGTILKLEEINEMPPSERPSPVEVRRLIAGILDEKLKSSKKRCRVVYFDDEKSWSGIRGDSICYSAEFTSLKSKLRIVVNYNGEGRMTKL